MLEKGYAHLRFCTLPLPGHSHNSDIIRVDVHCYTEDIDLFKVKPLKLSRYGIKCHFELVLARLTLFVLNEECWYKNQATTIDAGVASPARDAKIAGYATQLIFGNRIQYVFVERKQRHIAPGP